MDNDLELMLRRVLRPLIAALMRRGVGYIALRDLLKTFYVEEALAQREGAEAPTDSTISMVTGINRREVKRLREEAAQPADEAVRDAISGVNMAARVVATWASAEAFRDAAGEPRPLPVHGESGLDFDALLRAAKVDVRARTVIGELERAGVVERDAQGRLRLLRAAYTPETPREKMLFLGANLGDHLRSALHNLDGTGPAFIERALFHNGLDAAQVDVVRPVLADMADRLLRQANEALLRGSLAGTDTPAAAPDAGRKRLRLGVYYYEADADDAP